tara:strand:+ start:443 stop:835 length:393 start_codon:yes stop_codon:yes gene_type:complete
MATLKTNTLTGTSTAGSIAVTGEGNSTTTNLQQGLIKHWIEFKQEETETINDSFNAGASLTDVAVGKTKVSISNVMSNANYSVTATANQEGAIHVKSSQTTSLYEVRSLANDGTLTDAGTISVQVAGDLA